MRSGPVVFGATGTERGHGKDGRLPGRPEQAVLRHPAAAKWPSTGRAESAICFAARRSEDPPISLNVARALLWRDPPPAGQKAPESSIGCQFGCPRTNVVTQPCPRQCSTFLTCIGFSLDEALSF
jgi:hypothetical protein